MGASQWVDSSSSPVYMPRAAASSIVGASLCLAAMPSMRCGVGAHCGQRELLVAWLGGWVPLGFVLLLLLALGLLEWLPIGSSCPVMDRRCVHWCALGFGNPAGLVAIEYRHAWHPCISACIARWPHAFLESQPLHSATFTPALRPRTMHTTTY